MQEEWKVVVNYPNYSVSNLGRIKNKTGKILSPPKDKDGYVLVALSLGERNKKKFQFVHRLVLMAFGALNDPFGLRDQVNHINHIKDDNRIENLEWVTGSENIQKAIEFGSIPRKKKRRRKRSSSLLF